MIEKATILLVEDNPDDEFLALRALRKNNISNTVSVVHDGEEALDFLFCTNAYANRDPQDMPRLVLLDLNLPKVGGLEILRRLRADPRTQLLPIVVISSSDAGEDLVQVHRSGANSFMAKPVDYIQFLEFVWRLGKYWLELYEASPQ